MARCQAPETAYHSAFPSASARCFASSSRQLVWTWDEQFCAVLAKVYRAAARLNPPTQLRPN